MTKELNWENVELLVLMKVGDSRLARVFEKDGSEWWCQADSSPRFMGCNEPPGFGERVIVTGREASLQVEKFLNGDS